ETGAAKPAARSLLPAGNDCAAWYCGSALAGMEGRRHLKDHRILKAPYCLGADVCSDYQFRSAEENHFHPVHVSGTYSGRVITQGTEPSASGGCDWGNIFEPQRPGFRDCALTSLLYGLPAGNQEA